MKVEVYVFSGKIRSPNMRREIKYFDFPESFCKSIYEAHRKSVERFETITPNALFRYFTKDFRKQYKNEIQELKIIMRGKCIYAMCDCVEDISIFAKDKE